MKTILLAVAFVATFSMVSCGPKSASDSKSCDSTCVDSTVTIDTTIVVDTLTVEQDSSVK
jgi:hypothetical protein